jgi:hypothetical protein
MGKLNLPPARYELFRGNDVSFNRNLLRLLPATGLRSLDAFRLEQVTCSWANYEAKSRFRNSSDGSETSGEVLEHNAVTRFKTRT